MSSEVSNNSTRSNIGVDDEHDGNGDVIIDTGVVVV
jgi:hypothetical protein